LPSNKNQHYVPRCHLRPFSLDNLGKAINLHLVNKGRAIFRAPLKSQCSSDYFYGYDTVLEGKLSELEGLYASLITRLEDQNTRPTAYEQLFLTRFISLQSKRTAKQVGHALKSLREMHDFIQLSHKAHDTAWNEPRPDLQTAMSVLMDAFGYEIRVGLLNDLKVVLFKNKTKRDFVTSDDPAVLTNRWQLQRLKRSSFGTNSAGLVLFMPLGPRCSPSAPMAQKWGCELRSDLVSS
jgi:hypothetical protein